MPAFAAVTEYDRMSSGQLEAERGMLDCIASVEELLYLDNFREQIWEYGTEIIHKLPSSYLARVVLAAKTSREARRRIEIIDLLLAYRAS